MRLKDHNTVKLKKRMKVTSRFRNNVDAWILLIPAVIVLYLMIWRPTVLGTVWSFFKMRGYSIGEFCGLDNYRMVITHTQFLPTLWNTVKYVLWSLVLGYLPPLLLAVIINEMVHFNNGFRSIIYLPAVIPGIAAMLMWSYVYYPDQTGLLNVILMKLGLEPYTWLTNPNFAIPGIVIYCTWKAFPGTMLLYYASIQSVSTELYEAAIIDGAGMLNRAWNVTRPQIAGTLLLCLVNQIIAVFQIMQEPLAMTGGGPNGASISLGYQLYKYGFASGGKATGQAMALGVIIFLILLVLTIFYFRLNKKVEDNAY
ncbi:MAG: sugar ABC transporter permease [Clostridiales bacterium]|nr:sugar ABC transporter permease [Clostridiales bacterium]